MREHPMLEHQMRESSPYITAERSAARSSRRMRPAVVTLLLATALCVDRATTLTAQSLPQTAAAASRLVTQIGNRLRRSMPPMAMVASRRPLAVASSSTALSNASSVEAPSPAPLDAPQLPLPPPAPLA